MIFYFVSIRASSVTVGVALEYMAPVFVALLAPWVLHTRRQGIDLVAVAVARGRDGAPRAPGRDRRRRRGHASPASSSACSPASCSPRR